MPEVEIVFYQEEDGVAPVLNWLDDVAARRDRRIYAKCIDAIERLASQGHDLRRPRSDSVGRGIHELRILYFFHDRTAAVLAHGLTKEAKLPDKDIDIAVARKEKFAADPERHSFVEEQKDEQDD